MPRRNRGHQEESKQQRHGFGLSKISPLTSTQSEVFDAYKDNQNLMLHGVAGTGKTFLSLYLALNDVVQGVDQKKKVIIVRSVVPTRDMGFLPGNQKEKARAYESPTIQSVMNCLVEVMHMRL